MFAAGMGSNPVPPCSLLWLEKVNPYASLSLWEGRDAGASDLARCGMYHLHSELIGWNLLLGPTQPQ